MKWFIKMGITTVLTVSVTTTAFGEMHIEASDWAIPIIEKAYELELIPEELFARATENMTRREFTTLAIQFYQKMTGEKVDISGIHNPFWDTDQPEIVFAYAKGIITGKQEHIFKPDDTLTREQMAIILVRTLEKCNVEITETQQEIVFKDVEQLEQSVLPYIQKVNIAGIMNGFEDMFYPFKEVTVEEAVVAFTTMYEKYGMAAPQQNNTQVEQQPEQNVEQTPKTEQPEQNVEQTPKTEQPEQNAEQTPKTEQPEQNAEQTPKTEQPEQNAEAQQQDIIIDGKPISIGQSVSKLKSVWGEPSRIDQNSYSLERYVYINDYKHFFMVSIKDGKVAEIFTNDMTFQYKGITGKMDASDMKNVRYLDLKNFRVELKDENKDTYVLLNKDYKAEGILIRTSDYKQNLQLRYSQQFLQNFKTELIDIINSARVQENAVKLTSDETAENVAYYHSWDMSKNNYVAYTNQKGQNPFDRMTAGGVKYTMAGEGVLKIDGGDAIDAYHQFMMEAGTRTNMLNPELTHYGLATFDSNFTIYITLDLFTPAKE
ncbi:CAP-associated domain-containing protein [Lachnospiraceae bacterium 46-61]